MNSVLENSQSVQVHKEKPYLEHQKVYLRLIHYPQVGWLLLPPRNQIKEIQQGFQSAYAQFGSNQAIKLIKDMFLDMRDLSPKDLVDRFVEMLQIDVPIVVIKFKYHPESDIMEFVEELFIMTMDRHLGDVSI